LDSESRHSTAWHLSAVLDDERACACAPRKHLKDEILAAVRSSERYHLHTDFPAFVRWHLGPLRLCVATAAPQRKSGAKRPRIAAREYSDRRSADSGIAAWDTAARHPHTSQAVTGDRVKGGL
jgi:hypothetical protein